MTKAMVFDTKWGFHMEDIEDFGDFIIANNPGCRCIECATRTIGGKEYDIWYDGEFLFNGGQPVGYCPDTGEAFLGCVFICKGDDATGESLDMEQEDFDHVAQNMVYLRHNGTGQILPCFEFGYGEGY